MTPCTCRTKKGPWEKCPKHPVGPNTETTPAPTLTGDLPTMEEAAREVRARFEARSPCCGAPMNETEDDRAKVCSACDNTVYGQQ